MSEILLDGLAQERLFLIEPLDEPLSEPLDESYVSLIVSLMDSLTRLSCGLSWCT